MARFKVLTSRNVGEEPDKRRSQFTVEILEGVLGVGARFRLYETHRYADYTVCSVEFSGDQCIVYAEPDLWYDCWHEDSILDTDNPQAGQQYGYGSAGRHLYHPDALKALNDEENQEPIEG